MRDLHSVWVNTNHSERVKIMGGEVIIPAIIKTVAPVVTKTVIPAAASSVPAAAGGIPWLAVGGFLLAGVLIGVYSRQGEPTFSNLKAAKGHVLYTSQEKCRGQHLRRTSLLIRIKGSAEGVTDLVHRSEIGQSRNIIDGMPTMVKNLGESMIESGVLPVPDENNPGKYTFGELEDTTKNEKGELIYIFSGGKSVGEKDYVKYINAVVQGGQDPKLPGLTSTTQYADFVNQLSSAFSGPKVYDGVNVDGQNEFTNVDSLKLSEEVHDFKVSPFADHCYVKPESQYVPLPPATPQEPPQYHPEPPSNPQAKDGRTQPPVQALW